MTRAAKAPVGLTRRSLFRALAGASGVVAAGTGGVLQTRTMVEGEEILAARRLQQFFRDEAPLRA